MWFKSKKSYCERLESQYLIQLATIQNIDDVLQSTNLKNYNKVEIVLLTWWSVLIGIGIAVEDEVQIIECMNYVRNAMPKLFNCLLSGVEHNGKILLESRWIATDKESLMMCFDYFMKHQEVRRIDYAKLFIADQGRVGKWPDCDVGNVVEVAIKNIIPTTEQSKVNIHIEQLIVNYLSITINQIVSILKN